MAVNEEAYVPQLDEGDPQAYTDRYQAELSGQHDHRAMHIVARTGAVIVQRAAELPGVRRIREVIDQLSAANGSDQ